jgi:hypothetical protein
VTSLTSRDICDGTRNGGHTPAGWSTKRAAAARESLHKCWQKPPICYRGETDAIHVFGRTQASVTDQKKFGCYLTPHASGSEENPNLLGQCTLSAENQTLAKQWSCVGCASRLLPRALLSKPVYN